MLSVDTYIAAFYLSPAAICVTALDGRVIEVNESFCQLSGYSRQELIGRSAMELNLFADPWDRTKILALLKKDGSLKQCRNRVIRKDAEFRDTLGPVQIVHVDAQVGLLMMLLDVTPAERAENGTSQTG